MFRTVCVTVTVVVDDVKASAPPPDGGCFGPLRDMLHEKGLLTGHIERELAEGARFWEMERRLCQALSQGAEEKLHFNRTDVEVALRL